MFRVDGHSLQRTITDPALKKKKLFENIPQQQPDEEAPCVAFIARLCYYNSWLCDNKLLRVLLLLLFGARAAAAQQSSAHLKCS